MSTPLFTVPKKKVNVPSFGSIASNCNAQSPLFILEYVKFVKELADKKPIDYQLIKDLVPHDAYYVRVKHGVNRHELRFNNSYYITIPETLYELFDSKKEKYSIL